MFYGKSGGDFGPNGKRNDRFEQMTKQQQLIEQKKREIQSRLEAERQKKAVEEMMKESSQVGTVSSSTGSGSTSTSSSSSNKQRNNDRTGRDGGEKDVKKNVFANDGSFLAQFKQMQEEQMKKKEEEEAKNVKVKEEPASFVDEYGGVTSSQKIVKPSIKIINAEALNRSSSPSNSAGGGASSTNNQNQQGKNTSSALVPPPNYYHQAPPPPPPPPPPPIHQHERKYDSPQMLERKPFISGGYQIAPPPPPPPPPPPHQQPPQQSQQQQQSSNYGSFPSPAVKHLAQRVAEGGFEVEEMARVANKDDPLMWFLYKPESAEYRRFRELISQIKSENNFNQSYNSPQRQERSEYGGGGNNSNNGPLKRQNSSVSSGDEDDEKERREKKRRSRWGPQSGLEQPPAVAPLIPPPSQALMKAVSKFSAVPPPPPPPPQVKQESFDKYEMSVTEYGSSPSIPAMPSNNSVAMGLPQPIKNEFPWAGAGPSRFNAPPPPPPPPPTPQQQHQQQQQQPMLFPPGVGGFGAIANAPSGPPPVISKINRSNTQLLAYARQSYGTVDLDEEQWKQCEEAYKMNLIFQDIARKKARDEKLEKAGKFKHEYDSDEELDDGGTWEHKQRMKEMEKTRQWADELTSKAKGKHHIGDFLPPDELTKFMEKYKAVKEGRQMDESEYQEFKIAQDNIGFKMLQKMGWNDGQGLGSEGQGITTPVDKGNTVGDKQGLGVEKPNDLSEEDDEYTAYRKRMMLAYRFRPNPLNNPRRAYY